MHYLKMELNELGICKLDKISFRPSRANCFESHEIVIIIELDGDRNESKVY